MIIVNLFGAPGSGKSTGAAYVFSKLKLLGVNAELVTEFAKDKVWEESKAVFDDQLYIFAKQHFRISRCAKKVDVIITDSPLLLSMYYGKDKNEPALNKLIIDKINSFNNINYFINRVKSYNPAGRFQDEQGANIVNDEQKKFISYFLKFEEVNGNIEGYDSIVSQIIKNLGDKP